MAGNFASGPKPSGRLRMRLTSAPCGPHGGKSLVPQVLPLSLGALGRSTLQLNLAERARRADVVLKFAN
jgi:hypothetical protein